MKDGDSCKFRLVAAYLAMEPVPLVLSIARDLGGGSITEEVQTFIHEECINNKICRNYPSSQLYIKSLLKQIINDAEAQRHEVLDVFYEQYSQYLTYCKDSDLSQSMRKCYRNLMFIHPASSDIVLASHESQLIREPVTMTVTLRSSLNMLEGGTGCCVWPSSLFLSEFILSHQQLFSSKCCFEVGSGVGLVGICLANVNASKVVLSDGDLSALANLKHNLEINNVASIRKVECIHLRWESVSEEDLKNICAEVILGADVIYDIECVPHLVRVLSALLKTKQGSSEGVNRISDSTQSILNSGSSLVEGLIEQDKKISSCNRKTNILYRNAYPVAYIATVVRNIDTFDCFLRLAFKAGLEVKNITEVMNAVNLLPYLSSFERSSVCLYRISSLDFCRDPS